ncbi:Uncharacterised protein [Vibrio cholerae]|nr:Uncharacterised protein [Vibrio cholerae]
MTRHITQRLNFRFQFDNRFFKIKKIEAHLSILCDSAMPPSVRTG